MRKILIPTSLDNIARELLEAAGCTVIQDSDTDLKDLAKEHSDAYGMIVRSNRVSAEVIDSFPDLHIIVRAGAGYDNIDTKHARRQNIDVMNTPGANSNAVAEEVVALILAAYRHVVPADNSTRAGKWEKKSFMGHELTGKTIGILGMGNIGQLLVRRLNGFECRILTYDPVLSGSKADELGVELADLDELFKESDIISLHVPETDATRGLVNADLLQHVKQNVLIVNCARAGVVNEDDLAEAKRTKGLIYCNDVYPKDAAGEKSIAAIADVMLPHLGASTYEANNNAARRAAEQLLNYVNHGVTTYVVNKAVPAGLDEAYQTLAYYLSRVAHEFLGKDVPNQIEVSFYGGLDEYSNWLIAPIVLGLSDEFDPTFDYGQAEDMLREKGIVLSVRRTDESKNYGKSMTIDLIEGRDRELHRVSVRGTITEGKAMVSRINDFDKLYFDPIGHSVLVMYQDRPGVLAKITGVIARHDINIDDIRAPQDPRSGDSLAVLSLNQSASQTILEEIRQDAQAKTAVALSIV